jgi:predicted Ser/Thr protein kinase
MQKTELLIPRGMTGGNKTKGKSIMWTTADEIRFIKNLGNHGVSLRVQTAGRKALLRRYVEALKLRKDWKRINRKRVIGFAEESLKHA